MEIDILFKMYFRPLSIYALHILKDIHQAEDIVQECYLSYWERFMKEPAAGNMPSSPKQYLFSMVRNRCLDHIRKDPGHADLKEAEKYAGDEESEDMSFLEARMWTAIDSLPDKRRKIFLMAKRDGMKYEDIAADLGISVNTVRNQMAKALESVRNGNAKTLSFILAFL